MGKEEQQKPIFSSSSSSTSSSSASSPRLHSQVAKLRAEDLQMAKEMFEEANLLGSSHRLSIWQLTAHMKAALASSSPPARPFLPSPLGK